MQERNQPPTLFSESSNRNTPSSSSTAADAAAIPTPTAVKCPEIVQLEGELSALPCDMFVNSLLPKLDTHSVRNLARTCRGMYFFLEGFNEFSLIHRLAHFIVVNPNPEKARRLIQLKPSLLMSPVKEIKVNGISIKGYTPFQLAYGAGDGEMCMMLKMELTKFLGSEDAAINEIQRQLAEKKLNEIDQVKDEKIKKQLAVGLEQVIQAISEAQFTLRDDEKLAVSPATLEAITKFNAALNALQPKTIEEGMHFRLSTLQETLAAYLQAIRTYRFQNDQYSLFEESVLSSVLKLVPVNDAQRFSQGLFSLYEKKEPFTRSLILHDPLKNFYEYLHQPSEDFTISSSCINILLGKGWPTRIISSGRWLKNFDKYIEQKTAALQNACRLERSASLQLGQ